MTAAPAAQAAPRPASTRKRRPGRTAVNARTLRPKDIVTAASLLCPPRPATNAIAANAAIATPPARREDSCRPSIQSPAAHAAIHGTAISMAPAK
jgi:hypothetical protein